MKANFSVDGVRGGGMKAEREETRKEPAGSASPVLWALAVWDERDPPLGTEGRPCARDCHFTFTRINPIVSFSIGK